MAVHTIIHSGTKLVIRTLTGPSVNASGGAGTGDVVGPNGVTADGNVPRFNGTSGKALQDSDVNIDDSDNLTVPGTVNGRDVAADGTKLDGIEAGAQVNTVTSVNSETGAVTLSAADVGADASGTAASAVTTHESTFNHANLPTTDQKAALDGANAPSGANPLATMSDVGGGGGVTDHGALTGLGDDDHTQYHTDARALTWLGTRSTSDLPEGTNEYYTEAKVSANASVAANTAKVSADGSVTSHSDVTDAGSGAIITGAERTKLAGIEAGAEVNPADTDEVAEGATNLYYTEARVNANASVVANTAKVSADGSVTSHSDVSSAGSGAIITAGERADIGVAFKSDESGEIDALTEKVTPAAADLIVIEDSADGNSKKKVQVSNLPGGGGGVSDHGALTGLTDDDHTQYHTDARALTWLGTRTADDLPDGATNEYYTEAKVSANASVSANTAKVSADGSVTSHSDVTDAGSGAIITAAERADIGVAIKTDESGELAALTAKGSPVSGDILLIEDSADGNSKKRITIGDLPGGGVTDHGALTGLGDDDHTQYLLVDGTRAMSGALDLGSNGVTNPGNVLLTDQAAQISTVTEKVTPVSADIILIEDSADSNNKKRVQIGNLPSGGGGGSTTHRKSWSGQMTLGANNAWTTFNATLGRAWYQFNRLPGVNPPIATYDDHGFMVPGGATLQAIHIMGTFTNNDVDDVELFLRAHDADLTVATALNTPALVGSRTIIDTVAFGIAADSSHYWLASIDIPANEDSVGASVMLNRGQVIPFLRVQNTIGSSRGGLIEIELEWTE